MQSGPVEFAALDPRACQARLEDDIIRRGRRRLLQHRNPIVAAPCREQRIHQVAYLPRELVAPAGGQHLSRGGEPRIEIRRVEAADAQQYFGCASHIPSRLADAHQRREPLPGISQGAL